MCFIWSIFTGSRLDVSRRNKLICLCPRSVVSGWILHCPYNFGGALSANNYSYLCHCIKGLQIINRSSMALCIQEFEIARRSESHIDLPSRTESWHAALSPLLKFQVYDRYLLLHFSLDPKSGAALKHIFYYALICINKEMKSVLRSRYTVPHSLILLLVPWLWKNILPHIKNILNISHSPGFRMVHI